MSLAAWVRAARLPAQSNIAVPLALGVCLAHQRGAAFEAKRLVLTFAYGLTMQLFIVMSNDAHDVDTDRQNETFTPFSGGSRVLVEGMLTRSALVRASWLTGTATILLATIAALTLGRIEPLVLATVGIALAFAYSAPPLRVSFRGGGELLQWLGTGVVLPLYGYAVAAGSLAHFPWVIVALLAPIRIACAIATARPDEPSDRLTGKRTLPVLVGGKRAGYAMDMLSLASAALAVVTLDGFGVVYIVPSATFALLSLVVGGAEPGSRRMLVHVGAQITATLCLEIALAVWSVST